MTLKQFVREHREVITQQILNRCPNIGRLNDEERRGWVLNDEGLYNWARSAGVRI